MKTVILAGGFGTRLQEETNLIPKPLVEIGGKPIIWHIMQRYLRYGFNEFIIALGYKSHLIKKYFLDYHLMNSDFEVNLDNGNVSFFKKNNSDIKVKLIDTGIDTMTGGRLKRLSKYLSKETFFLTYGDGISNVDLLKLLKFHKSKKSLITMTVVRPPARFGVLETNEASMISTFEEKPQLKSGWINGGFFVCEPDFLRFCISDEEMLEKEPLQKVLSLKKLFAYHHYGFWKCMDNIRDKKDIEKMIESGNCPWLKP